MSDPRDYKLDLSSLADQRPSQTFPPRRFLCVLFDCCGIYQRIYRDASGTTYSGRCPRCGQSVRFAVGAQGTDARFFRVS
jgi:hypothetical protein